MLSSISLLVVFYHLAQATTNIYVGTYDGLAYSNDGGQTWTTKGPADGLGTGGIFSITSYNGVLYAGAANGISTSVDGGKTWTLGTPNSIPLVKSILGTPTGVFATSDEGHVALYVTQDNKNWKPANIPQLNSAMAYSIIQWKNKLYVGSDDGLLISADNGTTWTLQKSSAVYSLAGTSDKLFGSVDNAMGIEWTNDDGQSWHDISNGIPNYIVQVYTSNNILYASAEFEEFSPFPPGLYISNDDGVTWNSYLSQTKVVGVFVLDDVIYASTYNTGLLVSSDGGKTWNQSYRPADGTTLTVFVENV